MKLIEALEITRRAATEPVGKTIFLACGFTPLHLSAFLSAELLLRNPTGRPQVKSGVFGDLVGTLERFERQGIDALVVIVEWADIDPRLAVRSLGGWRVSQMHGITSSAHDSIARLQGAIVRASAKVPTVVCMPSLPLPPMFTALQTEASLSEAQLRFAVATLAERLVREPGLRIVNSQYLDDTSPLAERYDLKSDLFSGFPFTLRHASAVGKVLAVLIDPPVRKKGLITDLDDTLWAGIVGDDGIDGISWDLEHKSQMHGLYQQILASLASSGVLIGVASKNDPTTVKSAFERRKLILTENDIFPFEVHWSRKSDSVARILQSWNIAPDSVVFVDDSPMEVAEVQAAFPDMECIVFPTGDDRAIWDLFLHLRRLFGKSAVTEEDRLRAGSIRQGQAWKETENAPSDRADTFLKSAEARITFRTKAAADGRAFELLNKTNQFNLNGKRFTEAEWRNLLEDSGTFLITVSYEDKFGPLGKIAVIIGRTVERQVRVNSWVMSCRAFSRRIEFQCLRHLFDVFKAEEIVFDYEMTPRNTPVREFLATLLSGPPVPGSRLTVHDFSAKAPVLFHLIEEDVHV